MLRRLYNHLKKKPRNFRRFVRKLKFSFCTSTLSELKPSEIFCNLFIHVNSFSVTPILGQCSQRKAKIYALRGGLDILCNQHLGERAKSAENSTPKRLVYGDESLQLKSHQDEAFADILCFIMEILCSDVCTYRDSTA